MLSPRLAILALALCAAGVESRRRHHSGLTRCAKCAPMYGVSRLCSEGAATACEPCPPGTHTPDHPHLTVCKPCSECDEGLYIHAFCHATKDTVCGWCSNPMADRFAPDFIHKCGPRRVPEAVDDPLNKLWEERTKNEHVEDKLKPVTHAQHRLWILRDLRDGSIDPEIDFAPGFHEYTTQEQQKLRHTQKAYILLGLSSLLLVSAALLSLTLVRRRLCPASWVASRQRAYVHLSDQDQRIIEECARNLESKELKRQPSHPEFGITENPLAALLPDQPQVSYARTHRAVV